MLLFVACLLPLVAGLEPVTSMGNSSEYIYFAVKDGVLKKVQFGGDVSLDLSGLGIHTVEKNAFDDISDVESLDLSNNSLTVLPEFIFSNLTNLRNLSLSNNELSSLSNLFVGLENLQVLNISHNPIRHLRRGNFFGLAKNATIFTDENILWSISADVSTNFLLKDEQSLSPIDQPEEISDANQDDEEEVVYNELKPLSKDIRVKLCKSDGVVTSLEILREDKELGEGCVLVPIDIKESPAFVKERQVTLKEQGIVTFQRGWYQLPSLPINSLDLSNNEITEIGQEALNDLPADLTYVTFLGNKIRRIKQGVIENEHLRNLNFKNNLIEEIECDAFNKTRLSGLYLADNQLKDLKFVSTLPNNLIDLSLDGNHVTTIADGVFSQLSHLLHMSLTDNKIEVLGNNAFRGLASLQVLFLSKNSITTIEPSAFKGLTALYELHLSDNSIHGLQRGTFAELRALKRLNLSQNRIAEATFGDLPKSLKWFYVDYNNIEELGQGSFARSPRLVLSLANNQISRIVRGAFDLPTLKDLHLTNNSLSTMDGDSYEGLGLLRQLWLSQNKISEIRKGSCKNLGSLYVLDVSRNPFQKLDQGAFHGLCSVASSVHIYDNNLKQIQAGLFEDI